MEAAVGGMGAVQDFESTDFYRANAFRLSGLAVDATPRQVRRRLTELEGMRRLGHDLEPSTAICSVQPHPSVNAIVDALRRLQSPQRRLLDELFWLWPAPGAGLGGTTLDEAHATWTRLSKGDNPGRVVGLHNLAVVAHVSALEAAQNNGVRGPKRWRRVYDRWRAFLADAESRRWLGFRVESIADPRLRPDSVERLLAAVPEIVLETHVAQAKECDEDVLGGHRQAMHQSGFGAETVDTVLVEATAPAAARLREAGERVRRTSGEESDSAIRKLLKEVRHGRDAKLLRGLLGPEHGTTQGVLDSVAEAVRGRVVRELNAGGGNDSAESLEGLRSGTERLDTAEQIAAGHHLKAMIRQENAKLLNNLVVGTGNKLLAQVEANPRRGLDKSNELTADTRSAMARLSDLAPERTVSLKEDLRGLAFGMLVSYVNATLDVDAALPAIRGLRSGAIDRTLIDRMNEAISTLERMGRTAGGSRFAGRAAVCRCLFCGVETSGTRTITFKQLPRAYDQYGQRYELVCCSRCRSLPLKSKVAEWTFLLCCVVGGGLSLRALAVSGWNTVPLWMSVVVAAGGAVIAFHRMSRVSRNQLLLRSEPTLREAMDHGWTYNSGLSTMEFQHMNVDRRLLADVMVTVWRLRRAYPDDRRQVRAVADAAAALGLEARQYDGCPFDSGMRVKVLAVQPMAGLDREEVIETVRPAVYLDGSLLGMAEVVVGTPTDETIQEDGTT